MSSNVKVTFGVSGQELSNYITQIQKKSDDLTSSAIAGAIEQAKKGKEQLKIVDDHIKALERKNRIEAQGIRSLSLQGAAGSLELNKQKYDGIREQLYSDPKLAGNEKLLKEKINGVNGREKVDEEKIKNNYRENLTIAREVERQARIQTSLSRETIEALKQTAKENVKAITSGDMKLADVFKDANTDEEKLVARLTEDGIRDEKKMQGKESAGGGKAGLFGSLLAVDNINRFISSAGQLTQTQNGFDLIQPASSMAGRILGAAIGGLIGTFIVPGVGTGAGATAGAAIGGGIGEAAGSLWQREALTKQDFFKARNRFNAITGRDPNSSTNMEQSGVSVTDFLNVQSEISKKRGYSSDAERTAKESIYLDKGYGVDQGVSGSIIEMQRSSKEGNRNLALLVGGILQKGDGNIFKNGDHSYLNEFLGKFITVQKELLKTQTVVATGTTMDILSKFNRVGGEFASIDSRSSGNISAIQNGLSNPGSDNLKALSFSVLRKAMPNASIFDILAERQKGMASPTYLKEMLGTIEQLGGDESHQELNLAGMFPGLSLSAVKRLYQHRKELMSGRMSTDELRSNYKNDFQSRSESNTNDVEKNTALVTNGILNGEAVSKMMDVFESAIKESLGGAVITLNNGQGTIALKPRGVIAKENQTKEAAQKKAKEIIERMNNWF